VSRHCLIKRDNYNRLRKGQVIPYDVIGKIKNVANGS